MAENMSGLMMEDALCLATKATETTIHVCARAAGHIDEHVDPIDGVTWPNTQRGQEGHAEGQEEAA
jgi:hypothetical protein